MIKRSSTGGLFLKKSTLNNPLANQPLTNNIETDDQAELAIVHNALAESDRKHGIPDFIQPDVLAPTNEPGSAVSALRQQQAALDGAINLGYTIHLVFVTQAQADEFIQKANLTTCEDDTGAFYDGIAVAKKLGITLEPAPTRFRETQPDKLAKDIGIHPYTEQ